MSNRLFKVLAKGAATFALAFGLSPAFADDHFWFPPEPLSAYGIAAQPAGETRTVIDRDGASHRITRIVRIPSWGGIQGTKVFAFYPGTRKVRLEAESSWDETVATYRRREDGSRSCVLRLSHAMTVVQCYDNTGIKLVLQQYWFQ